MACEGRVARSRTEHDYRGLFGYLLATIAVVVTILAAGFASVDPPAWWTAAFERGERAPTDDSGYGPFVLLFLAWSVIGGAAILAAVPVVDIGNRIGAQYLPIAILGEGAGAAATVAFFVLLGLASDAWNLLAASVLLGLLVIVLVGILIHRLKRRWRRGIAPTGDDRSAGK